MNSDVAPFSFRKETVSWELSYKFFWEDDMPFKYEMTINSGESWNVDLTNDCDFLISVAFFDYIPVFMHIIGVFLTIFDAAACTHGFN